MLCDLLFLAASLTALSLNAVAVEASTMPERCRELRLGGAIALSGSLESSAKACVQGWTLWAERLNARGGLRLANQSCSIRLPFDLRDDGSVAAASKDILEDMLDPKSPNYADLDFVIGPFSSGITQGNAEVAKNAERILFSHGASENLYNHGNQYIFSTLTPGGFYMDSGLNLLFANGARSVVFAHEDKSFSKSVCNGGNKTAHDLGMQVLGYFEYPAGKTNFADIVYNIKKLGADVYVGCGHIDDITYLVGNANVLNVNPSALLVTHAADGRIVKNVGIQNSHGLLSPTQWDRHLKFFDDDGFFGSAQQFNELFIQRWGAQPSYASAYSAAMGYALQKAIETAKSYDTHEVRRALLTLNLNSFYGPIKFSGPGDPSGLVGTMPSREMVTTQIFNGSIEVVAPQYAASGNLLYPLPTWSERQLMLYPCKLGYFEKGISVDGSAICEPCPHGQYRDQFSAMCVSCQPGQISSRPGASSCESCPAATYSEKEFGSTACLPCPSGFFCTGGSSEPAACPKGHFCLADRLLPTPCPEGTYRDREGGTEASACFECHPGRFGNRAGMVKCLQCAAGWYTADSGERACRECPVSTYQASQGQTNCTACPPTFVTYFSGADSAAECVCERSFFLNRVTGRCSQCPWGALCPGGSAVPYVKEGYYAHLQGDPNRSIGDPQAFSDLVVWGCPQPSLTFCPGHSLPNLASTGNDMLHAVRLPNECPFNHHGVTCAWCNEGHFFDGNQCADCGAYAHVSTSFAIMILGSVIAGVLHRFAGHPVPKSFVGKMLLANVAGLAVFFVQILSLLLSLDLKIPPHSFLSGGGVSTASRFSMLDVPFWQPGCIFGNTFSSAYSHRVAIPFFITAVFFGNWFASVMMNGISSGRIPRMSFDHSVNVCGLVLQALYIFLCKVGLSYFECRSHASAPDTLVAYPAVICDSDEHRHMLPVGITTIALYMVGIFAIMLYCCIVAPERYLADANFRRRVCFMVDKWRPDKWYWGMVYMLRNVAMTLVFVVVQEGAILQCSLILTVLTISMITLAFNRPWKDQRSSCADLGTTMLLCLLCVMCFQFPPEQTGVTSIHTAWLETVIEILCYSVAVVLLLSIAYAILLLSNHVQRSESHQDNIDRIARDLIFLGQQLAKCNVEKLIESFVCFTQVDFADIKRSLQILAQCNEPEMTLCASQKSVLPRRLYLSRYASISVGETLGAVLSQARTKSVVGGSSKVGLVNDGAAHFGLSRGTQSDIVTQSLRSMSSGGSGMQFAERPSKTEPSLPDLPVLLTPSFFPSNKGQEIHPDEVAGFEREKAANLRSSPQCVGDCGPAPSDISFDDMVLQTAISAIIPTCIGATTREV